MKSNQKNNLGIGLLAFGQIFSWAGLFYVFAAFLVTWEKNLAWSKAELTLGFSLAIFVSAISAPLIGKLIDSGFGKWVMPTGAFVGAIALFSITLEGDYLTFIISWIIIGFAQSACLYEACFSHVLKLNPAESRRVVTHVSIVAGLAPSVAFVFGAILTNIFSWQIAITIFSIGVATLAAPTLFLGALIFEYPTDGVGSVVSSQREKLSSWEVFSKPIFWLIGIAFFLIAINHGILTNHLIPILMDRGAGYSFAIVTASLIGPSQIIGRLILLKFGSKFGISVVTLISFENEELLLESKVPVDDEYIDSIISNLGNYNVKNQNANLFSKFLSHLNSKKPILLALMIVIVSSLSLQTPLRNFDLDNWFITYMGLFFMLFSFLKLLNIKGFSITFSKYDLLGKNIPGFGVSYPFLEFCLGIAFLTNSLLIIANLATLIFMISQCVGVTNVLRKKEVIQCACLGSSINLPVSYLTLVENLVMVSMSSYMLFTLLN